MSSTSLKLVSDIGLNDRGAFDPGPGGVVSVNNTSVTVCGISGESNSSNELNNTHWNLILHSVQCIFSYQVGYSDTSERPNNIVSKFNLKKTINEQKKIQEKIKRIREGIFK